MTPNSLAVCNRNHKLQISTTPTKANQLIHRCLTKTKSIDRGSRSRKPGRQTVRCCLELIQKTEEGRGKMMNQDRVY